MSPDPRPIKGKGAYHLIPTVSRGWPPSGWVDTSRITGPSVRRITPGYISQRLPRTNTIAMNQNYVRRVLENPRTPVENREAIIEYVLVHPERFTPHIDYTDDPVRNEWARKMNGNADFGFMREFRNIFGRYS